MRNDLSRRCHACPSAGGKSVSWPAAAFFLTAIAILAVAQSNSAIRGFKAAVAYYPPPDDTQISTLLEGEEAEPGTEGRIRITRGRIQYFARNGRLDLTVEAPYCVLDTVQQAVNSPGPLRVRSGDGRLSLEGDGFLWQQTNSNLIISNRVRTVISSAPEKLLRP